MSKKKKESIYILEYIKDNSELILRLDNNGTISLHCQGIKDLYTFLVEGEDKEAYATCLLAGFEETGYRLVGEI